MATIKGQVGIVTGASRGIGRAIAERLVREGASVALAYHPDDGEDEVAEAVSSLAGRGAEVISVAADVTSESDMSRLFEVTTETLGPIDIVVNNAGGGPGGMLADATATDFERIFALNVKSVVLSTALCARHLRQAGRIVNIASITAVEPTAGLGLYAASKAAVCSLTQVAAIELGGRSIRVNAVLPGLIPTALTSNLAQAIWDKALTRTILGRHGLPQDVANVVAFLVGPDSAWMTGQLIRVNGGSSS